MRKLWNSSINLLFVYFVNLILLVSLNSLLTLILQELSTTQEIEDIVQLSETDRLQIATDITEAVTFLHNLSQVYTVMTIKYDTAGNFKENY